MNVSDTNASASPEATASTRDETAASTPQSTNPPMPPLNTSPPKKDFPGSLLKMFNKDHEQHKECYDIFKVLIENATKRGYEKTIAWGQKKKWLVENGDSIYNTEFTATGRFSEYNQPTTNTANSNRVLTAWNSVESKFEKEHLNHGHSPADADSGEKIPEHYRDVYVPWYKLKKSAPDNNAPKQAALQREVQNDSIGDMNPMGPNPNDW